jgi:flagellar protein FlaG
VRDTEADREEFEHPDVLRDVLKRTAELLSMGDRGLKFEMIEDADLYQLQVIDMSDGRVVRKVPPDEVLKIIANLKEQISDHVDVLA